MTKIEMLFEVFTGMDKYTKLIPNECCLSEYMKVELDKEKEIVYLTENNQTIELNEDSFKVNLNYILDSIFENLLSIDVLGEYENYNDEEYINYAGTICLLNAKFNDISEKLDML